MTSFQFIKDDVVQFVERERRFTPTYFNIFNEHFFPIAQLNTQDQKRAFRRFSNGFTEMFCYWETAKAFPITKNVFACHYRYYMDCDNLPDYFKAMGPEAEDHHKCMIWS
ncbi:hypothetical protein AAVH_29640 [Aphelenchoides avenae]|nr:hypothetical protein AAVH_29640 [Aphelenchus avenae]